MSGASDTQVSGIEPSDRAGQVLGEKYRLVRLIGEGGMGAVYEAQHLVVKRRFAVKLLRPELAKNPDVIARFRREAEAAGALESEHVAAVTDFGAAPDGAPYLVMEYLVGESVAELLAREGPLPVPRAVSIVLQVCRGLEVAHAAGIVHRDLKPDNLFVVRRTDGSDLVKILDFGIAKLQGAPASVNVTRTGSALGTPFYMAPEQARGDKTIDRRADVYALGVILYELLSGEKPHPGDSYNAILAHILTAPPAPLASARKGLPEALAKVVHRALAFDPKDRPEAASALARDLAAFAGREVTPIQSQLELRVAAPGTPTLATPELASGVSGRTSRRTRWPIVLLPLLAAAVAGAAWLAPGSPSDAPSSPADSPAVEPTTTQAIPSGTVLEVPPAASAAAVLPVASEAQPSGSIAERSGDKPRSRVSAAPRPAASSPGRVAVPANSAVSVPPAAAKKAARGATFDPTNPYQ